jgi:methyl-accepting chemotaxis protein
MEPVTLNSLWVIICIILASGGVVFSAFTLFNNANDKIMKLAVRVGNVEHMCTTTASQTAEVMDTVKDIQENVSDIRITQTELRVVLSGTDGHNGLRGELRELKSQLRELMNKM